MATCETGQVLLAGVPGGFSRGSPVFAPPTVWCFSYDVMYDSYLLKDVHSVLVNFPREYAQESMMLYI